MLFKFLAPSLALLTSFQSFTQVSAHTMVYSVNTPTAKNVKCNRPTTGGNSPIKNVMSPDMTCGQGASPAPSQCEVAAGQTIQFVYGHDAPQDDVMDPTHVGPCNVYLVKVDTFGPAPTEGWIKILQGTWDPQNKWCSDKLINNKGLLDIPIPAQVPAGNYIIRSELNALHEADRNGGAQFYVYCADVKVTGTGTGKASGRSVAIPSNDYYTPTTPGILYNIYASGGDVHTNPANSKYPTIGPELSTFVASDSPSSPPYSSTGGATISATPTSSPTSSDKTMTPVPSDSPSSPPYSSTGGATISATPTSSPTSSDKTMTPVPSDSPSSPPDSSTGGATISATPTSSPTSSDKTMTPVPTANPGTLPGTMTMDCQLLGYSTVTDPVVVLMCKMINKAQR